MAANGEVNKLVCPRCGGPFADLRGVAFNADQFRMEDGRCFQFDKQTIECREDHLAQWKFRPCVPLHAQVADALGWTKLQDRGDGLWIGVQPETGLTVEVPPYGASWCSTGPLVNRFKINVTATPNESIAWYAHSYEGDGAQQWAETPCEAIARVVVELHRKKEK